MLQYNIHVNSSEHEKNAFLNLFWFVAKIFLIFFSGRWITESI